MPYGSCAINRAAYTIYYRGRFRRRIHRNGADIVAFEMVVSPGRLLLLRQ